MTSSEAKTYHVLASECLRLADETERFEDRDMLIELSRIWMESSAAGRKACSGEERIQTSRLKSAGQRPHTGGADAPKRVRKRKGASGPRQANRRLLRMGSDGQIRQMARAGQRLRWTNAAVFLPYTQRGDRA